jgi:hypothetical protein
MPSAIFVSALVKNMIVFAEKGLVRLECVGCGFYFLLGLLG